MAPWTTLFKHTPNDGVQVWKVKGPAPTQARIRVRSLRTPSVGVVSLTEISQGAFLAEAADLQTLLRSRLEGAPTPPRRAHHP